MKNKHRKLKILIVIVLLVFLNITVIPAITLHFFLNRHYSYKGTESAKNPMQGIYKACDFSLVEKIHTLKTKDGEKLWVSEISPNSPDAVVIYLSGIVQPSVTYFYGHAKIMFNDNIATFLLEVRSHGESTGKQLGLGYTEVEDVRTVIDYIQSKKKYNNVPIILHGVSMGGAIALNAFGMLDEVDACIAMSPYASFEKQLDLLMKKYNIPAFIRKYELFISKRVLYFNYSKHIVSTMKPELQIQNAKGRPVAIIACSGDDSVPVENTYILKECADYADVWIRDSWEHFIVKDCNFKNVEEDTEYCDYIKQFIQKVVERQN